MDLTISTGLARRGDNFLWLRIIAALMVIYGHALIISPLPGVTDLFASWRTYSGEIAVDIFFAVSGFLVSGSFVRRPDFLDFMLARMLRVLPALIVCLLLLAFVIGPIVSSLDIQSYFADKQPRRFVRWMLQFSSRQTYDLPGVFSDNPLRNTVNGSLWTLSAEMRMYIFLGIMGTLGMFRSRLFATIFFICLFIAGAICPWNLPLFYAWVKMGGYFSLGVLAFIYKDRIPVRTDIMLVLAYLAFLSRGVWIYQPLLAIAIVYFCFWFAYRLRLPDVQRFGDPSYGIYLWGWPMSQLFAQLFGSGHPYLCTLTASVASLLIGYLSWHAVESPAMRLKRRIVLPAFVDRWK